MMGYQGGTFRRPRVLARIEADRSKCVCCAGVAVNILKGGPCPELVNGLSLPSPEPQTKQLGQNHSTRAT